MDGRLEYSNRKIGPGSFIPLDLPAPKLTALKARHVSLKRESFSHESFRNLVESSRYVITFALDSHVQLHHVLRLLPYLCRYFTILYFSLYHRNFSLGAEGTGGGGGVSCVDLFYCLNSLWVAVWQTLLAVCL
jgi:hypothetical protein